MSNSNSNSRISSLADGVFTLELSEMKAIQTNYTKAIKICSVLDLLFIFYIEVSCWTSDHKTWEQSEGYNHL